jgi:hypothetical protein
MGAPLQGDREFGHAGYVGMNSQGVMVGIGHMF